MKKIMSIIYSMAAITALIIGCFTFKLSAFVGSLFTVMTLAFVVIAIIIARQHKRTNHPLLNAAYHHDSQSQAWKPMQSERTLTLTFKTSRT